MKKIIFTLSLAVYSILCSFGQCLQFQYPPPPCNPCPVITEKPCGIYVIVNLENPVVASCSTGACPVNLHPFCYKNYPEYYNGIFIKFRWKDLQPLTGSNGWQNSFDPAFLTTLLSVFDFAENNPYGVKQISIGIVAGNGTPDWVINGMLNQAHCFGCGGNSLNYIAHFGSANAQVQIIDNYPVPWDGNFTGAYNQMMLDFHTYLMSAHTSNGTLYNNLVKMIKLTGVNINYEETRLLNQDDSFYYTDPATGNNTCATDVIPLWQGPLVQYTHDKVVNAWALMATNTKNIFTSQFLNLVILPTPGAFPPFDCQMPGPNTFVCPLSSQQYCYIPSCYSGQGCVLNNDCHHYNYDPAAFPDITEQLVRYSLLNLGPKIAINSTFLNKNPNSTMQIIFPNTNIPPYGMIGYQQLEMDYYNAWPDIAFKNTVLNAVNSRGQFLELFPATISWFACRPESGYANLMDWANRTMQNQCGVPH